MKTAQVLVAFQLFGFSPCFSLGQLLACSWWQYWGRTSQYQHSALASSAKVEQEPATVNHRLQLSDYQTVSSASRAQEKLQRNSTLLPRPSTTRRLSMICSFLDCHLSHCKSPAEVLPDSLLWKDLIILCSDASCPRLFNIKSVTPCSETQTSHKCDKNVAKFLQSLEPPNSTNREAHWSIKGTVDESERSHNSLEGEKATRQFKQLVHVQFLRVLDQTKNHFLIQQLSHSCHGPPLAELLGYTYAECRLLIRCLHLSQANHTEKLCWKKKTKSTIAVLEDCDILN